MKKSIEKFSLNGKVCLITGGAGFLGQKHAEAILEASGIPVLLDINKERILSVTKILAKKYHKVVFGLSADITDKKDLERIKKEVLNKYKRIDVLINNAANNPKVENNKDNKKSWSRFENFPESIWNEDLNVGLKGAFFASQVFGTEMAKRKKGVILNISSDLGVIAPDQRIYKKKGLKEKQQPVKPVTYSVIKHALIGLTKYLATYWADKGVRVNALCPGGIYHNQEKEFVNKVTNLIPIGRMAKPDEYKATIVYMISDASSYMTGSTLIVDGGRTAW